MSKKNKLILLISILLLIIIVSVIIFVVILKSPSIDGKWYNKNYIDLTNRNRPEDSNDRILFALLKQPYEFTFTGSEMQIIYRYANITEKETYYYKIDRDKLYYSKDHSTLNDKYYIIIKQTKDEICLKGTKIDDDEIVLKKE